MSGVLLSRRGAIAKPTASAPFDFASVTGLKANYDGSLLAGADGASIASVADQAAVLGAMSQGVVAPTVKAAGINGLKVMNFNGSSSLGGNDQYFTLPSLAALSLAAATMFMVFQCNADPPASSANSGLWKMGTDASTTHFPFTDSNVYDQFGTTARKSTGNPTPSLAAAHIYEVTTKSGGWTSYFDGTQHFTTATNTVGFSSSPELGRSSSGAWFKGYVGQWLLYDGDLGSTDRTNIRAALKSIWGTP